MQSVLVCAVLACRHRLRKFPGFPPVLLRDRAVLGLIGLDQPHRGTVALVLLGPRGADVGLRGQVWTIHSSSGLPACSAARLSFPSISAGTEIEMVRSLMAVAYSPRVVGAVTSTALEYAFQPPMPLIVASAKSDANTS